MRADDEIRKWRQTRDSVDLKIVHNLLNQALKIDPEYISALNGKAMLFAQLNCFD